MAIVIVMAETCTRDVLSISNESEALSEVKEKLIFSSDNSEEGQLLVYFSEDAISTVEGMVLTRAGDVVTRSGIEGLDDVLEEIGVVSLKRVFPINTKTEERTREAGLHRWYIVNFDTAVDLDEAALALAAYSEVSRVQFDLKVERVIPEIDSELVVASMDDFPLTKSSTSTFNDTFLPFQWNLINNGDTSIYSDIEEGADVRCEDAWKICAGDPRIIVAIVDDAVKYDHPDLAANMWVNSGEVAGNGIDDDGNGYTDDVYGYNFVHNTGTINVDTSDAGYHGCHVAGIVAAVNNNGIGVCGVAGGTGNNDGVRLMSCQVFYGENETATISDLAKAFKYAADNGASILQCSFGYDVSEITSDNIYKSLLSAEYAALQYFVNTKNCDALEGGLVIFSAGNDMTAMSTYPGAYKDFISVTAISCDYTPAYYTNYDYGCNVAAPGGDLYQSYLTSGNSKTGVLSTSNKNNTYIYSQGTSMACPHVSGVAALGLSYALQLGNSFSLDEFKGLLLSSVYGIDEFCTGSKEYLSDYGAFRTLYLSQFAGKMGSGAIDAYRMLMNVRGTTCIPVSNNSQTVIDLADYISDGYANFELVSATISDEDMESLGMSSAPVINGTTITIECSKTGSGILSLNLRYGTSSSDISGTTVTQEFALLARASHSENGGWL